MPLLRTLNVTLATSFNSDSFIDENVAAMVMDLPLMVFLISGLLISLISAIWLWILIPKTQRWIALASMLIGYMLGLAIYTESLGPWLLP